MKTIEFGYCSNAIGVVYSKAPYWRTTTGDCRPMLTIDIFFLKVWILLPWNHAENKGNGSASKCWGFWCKPFDAYLSLYCGWKSKIFK